MGAGLSIRERGALRRSPLGQAALGVGAHDCGPERSLRTAPLSSSSAFGSLRIPSGASRLPTPRAACPRGYVRLGLSRCWTRVQGMKSAGLPLVAARAAARGVCAFEGEAGARCAGVEWFSIGPRVRGRGGGGRRDGCHVARDESAAPPTNRRSARNLSVMLDSAASTRESHPRATAPSRRRKTPRKPQKGRPRGRLRRAPQDPLPPPLMANTMPSTPLAPEVVTKSHRERVAGAAGDGGACRCARGKP